MNTNSTLNNSEEMRVINQLALASIPNEMTKGLNSTNLKSIISEMASNIARADAIKTKGERLQRDLDACVFFDGKEKQAINQNNVDGLNVSFAIAKNQSQLIVFNTYISKVLAEQQTIISNQQRELENQNEQLKDNQRELKQNQDTIREHQEIIAKQNEKIRLESQEIMKLYKHFEKVGLEVGKNININELIGEIKGFVDNVKNSSAEENRKTKEVLTQKINDLQLVISNDTDHKLQKFNSHFADLQKEQQDSLKEVTSECAKRQTELETFKQEQLKQITKRDEESSQQIKTLQNSLGQTISQSLTETGKKYNELQAEQKNKLSEVTSECTKRQAELETFKLEQLKQINLRGEEAGQQIKTLQSYLEQTIKQNLIETGQKYSELQVEQKSKLDELAKDFATMQTANENQKNELLQNFDDLKEQHKNNFEELKLAQGEKLATLDEENLKLREQISTLTSNEELLKASIAKNKIFSYVGVAAFLLVVYNLLVTYQVI